MPTTITFISVFVLTLLVLFALKPIAFKAGLLDYPGGRKDHVNATPLVGGIGIFLATLAISLFTPELFNHYRALLLIAGLVLIIGIADDYKDLSVSIRIGSQIIAAGLMSYVSGNHLSSLGNLFTTGAITLGILSVPFTAFATVGLINAVNMSDGVDGLCGGMLLITLTFVGIVNYQQEALIQAGFIAMLICALLAYLTLNFRPVWKRPALVYLGDSGSTFMGFVLAWLLIESTQGDNPVMPPILALWFMAVPIMDTITLLIKRPLEGKSPFAAGRDHLHHRLLGSGLSTRRVVVILYGVGIVMGVTGLIAFNYGVSESALFFSFLLLFTAYFCIIKFQVKT